eukprot:g11709.t1
MIRGIGYADSRVTDDKGLLWFDLARGMVDIRVKIPGLHAYDEFYERMLSKGIEIYDFSHHVSYDFDSQSFDPAYRVTEVSLTYKPTPAKILHQLLQSTGTSQETGSETQTTLRGFSNTLEAQLEDSILCAFGSPFLSIREDERIWKTPKIEKRFQRWALLVGAAVLTDEGVESWGAGLALFEYLQFGLVFFFEDLGAWMDGERGRAGGTTTTSTNTNRVGSESANTSFASGPDHLHKLLQSLDGKHPHTAHTDIFSFLQVVAASTLKAFAKGRLYRQALKKYYHVIDPAVKDTRLDVLVAV